MTKQSLVKILTHPKCTSSCSKLEHATDELCHQKAYVIPNTYTVKPVQNDHSQKDQILVFNANYRLMQVSFGAYAILLTFIKQPFVIKKFGFVYF